MIAAYIRVSSRAQDLRTQRDAITRAARARGERVAKWYQEKASARTLERPALRALLDAAKAGRVSKVYVFRVDRLSRSGIRLTLALLEDLRGWGCRVVTVADGFDLEGPAADVVLAVISWAAQMERAAIGERISAARVRIEKAGGRWGRPRRYVNVARARAMQGTKSLRQIAVALKVPRATLARALSQKPPKKNAAKRGTQI